MTLDEIRIETRISRSAWFLRDLRFPIPKPFLIEFIKRSASSAALLEPLAKDVPFGGCADPGRGVL
jgi:hypothetical protein